MMVNEVVKAGKESTVVMGTFSGLTGIDEINLSIATPFSRILKP